MIADFRLALGFLTRIPVPIPDELPVGALARSMRLFPLIGALIGAAIGGLYLLTAKILPGWPAALLAITFSLFLTGALHEDGLADCADGFGGGRDKDGKLAIMRDSRIGAYGALALILSVGLRAAALIKLANPAGALIAAHALSRGALPGLMVDLPPASSTGLAANAGKPTERDYIIALFLGILITAPFGGRWLTCALMANAAAYVALKLLAKRQIGGYSGDVLGALQQVVEIAILLTLAALT